MLWTSYTTRSRRALSGYGSYLHLAQPHLPLLTLPGPGVIGESDSAERLPVTWAQKAPLGYS